MRNIALLFVLALGTTRLVAQQPAVFIPSDTAALDVKAFAARVTGSTTGNYQKAVHLLQWLGTNFQWTSTDYKKRSVKEIIVRKGGNCFELARVYMAMLRELGIRYRPIAEINIHRFSEQRGATAEGKIKEAGNRMSVFGQQHNDHRWVEIFDEQTSQWVPADPTMNIIGLEPWLKGRAWFGERHTLNDEISRDMIAPFAIFVVNPGQSSRMEENRTLYYMVDGLDALYDYKLSQLPSWPKWVDGLKTLSEAARKAFAGEVNLHQYNAQIAALALVYQDLKEEYNAKVEKE